MRRIIWQFTLRIPITCWISCTNSGAITFRCSFRATDPIGIKGVLSSIRAPHHLIVKLEGESLFNDAMCIALFMTLLNVLQGEHFSLVATLEALLYEIVVAVGIGWAFGVGCCVYYVVNTKWSP